LLDDYLFMYFRTVAGTGEFFHPSTETAEPMKAALFAIPREHGSWALWLGPFLAGWGVAEQSTLPLLWVFLAVLSVFLARHPLTILVRSMAGRRKREDARPAFIWSLIYLAAASLFALKLALSGFAPLLLLALPATALLIWQLALVARRQERQMPVEIIGSGVLALAAPASYIAATGTWSMMALWLWILTWLYSIVSIVYVYLRLEQRQLDETPDSDERLEMGRPAMRVAAAALLLVTLLTLTRQLPRFAPVPFVVTQIHVIWGVVSPAVGARPQRVGFAQVGAFILFVALLIIVL
jgi:hypothetical protein